MFRNRISLFSGLVTVAVICMTVHPCLARPQDTSTGDPAQSQTTSTTPPAVSTTPQTSPESPKAETATKTQVLVPAVQPADKKKPKKVWTNDELKSVKTGVSVVGDANKGTTTRHSHARKDDEENDNPSPHQQQVEEYRSQIRELRDRIEAVDKRIAQLKDFKAENTSASGGIDLHQKYNMEPVADQVKQLEDAKKKLQAQIEDIENEARKTRIEPGELR
jgi:archaellum component FlaC